MKQAIQKYQEREQEKENQIIELKQRLEQAEEAKDKMRKELINI